MLFFSVRSRQMSLLFAASITVSSLACAPRTVAGLPTLAEVSVAPTTLFAEDTPNLVRFDAPFLFAYGTWEKRARIENRRALLSAEGITAKGGGGCNMMSDLAAYADRCPVLRVKVGPKNTLKTLRLLLKDDSTDRTATFDFPLPDKPTGEVALVTARDGATLGKPNATEKGGIELSRVRQWQLMGDWGSDGPVDVEVESILLAEPDAAAKAAQAERAQQDAARNEQAKAEQAALRAKYGKRTENLPKVVEVGRVAPDVVAVTIQAGQVNHSRLEPYVPKAGDERRTDGNNVLLKRGGQEIGWLVGSKRDTFIPFEKTVGDPLLDDGADDPATYTVTGDDPAFAGGVRPLAVYRKSKPTDAAQPAYTLVMRHVVYLKLPKPLATGKTYTVRFGDRLNVSQPEARLVCDDAHTRSEAVHVSQIGFRPDDPIKHGFLSIWLGTGGGYEYAAPPKFSVVEEATGKVLLRGTAELAKAKDAPDKLWQGKPVNYQKTAVYRLDFSALATPGRYRLAVEGVGASYPFVIGNNTWRTAFVTQMRGLFHERSGVTLGPPYTTFRKPRDFHPADGVVITQSTYNVVDGDGKTENFDAIVKGDTGKPVPEAWGGYHDAGDWNPRRVTHLKVTMAQLELLQIYPGYIGAVKLNIPPKPKVPDVLTEALFELDLFRRLQKPDGGVPFQIETQGDPGGGIVSWKQTQPAYVTAPDPWASWYYAGVAARAAKLLAPFAPDLARTYRASAVKAMAWAERDYARRKGDGTVGKITWEMRDARNLAALLCYDLTGEQRWYDVFREDTCLKQEGASLFAWGDHVQRDAAFAYALLPPSRKPDPAFKARAIAGLRQQADAALAYANGNAYRLTTPDSGRPMFVGFWSVPDAAELCRAHYLTGDKRYLVGAVQACIFAAGGNPNNMTYTTGLGVNPPRNPLHLDSRWSGQPAPEGLTVYGNFDWPNWPDQQWALWPMQYHLGPQCKPSAYEWPVPEAYFDIFLYPATNEWTVDTWAPNVYIWGYLAARGSSLTKGVATALRP